MALLEVMPILVVIMSHLFWQFIYYLERRKKDFSLKNLGSVTFIRSGVLQIKPASALDVSSASARTENNQTNDEVQ